MTSFFGFSIIHLKMVFLRYMLLMIRVIMILSMFNFIAHNLGTLHKLILINVFDDSWMMIISIMLSHFNVIMHRVPVSL